MYGGKNKKKLKKGVNILPLKPQTQLITVSKY
jgi:hypothetical protein